jgi:hypothetical protein
MQYSEPSHALQATLRTETTLRGLPTEMAVHSWRGEDCSLTESHPSKEQVWHGNRDRNTILSTIRDGSAGTHRPLDHHGESSGRCRKSEKLSKKTRHEQQLPLELGQCPDEIILLQHFASVKFHQSLPNPVIQLGTPIFLYSTVTPTVDGNRSATCACATSAAAANSQGRPRVSINWWRTLCSTITATSGMPGKPSSLTNSPLTTRPGGTFHISIHCHEKPIPQ